VEPIADVVRGELTRFGAPSGMPELLEAWVEIAGSEIVRNAWPARVARDGTLHVATSSSAWAFELTQLAPEILRRLSEQMGESSPKALRFAPGHLPEPPGPAPETARPEAVVPSAGDRAAARRLAAEIDDEELRRRVQKAAALSLARARSGRSV
jgi:hypothetical protein